MRLRSQLLAVRERPDGTEPQEARKLETEQSHVCIFHKGIQMLKRIAFVLVACLIPTLSGCGVFVAGHLLDKATDNMVKLMEAEARIEKEKRAQSYTIEGRFGSLEMKEEQVPETDTAKIEKKEENGKATVTRPMRKVKTCVITFEDGRQKSFRTVPSSEMEKGKKYRITYNGMDEITSVNTLP
jgi:hypothetical protein